MMKCWRIFAHKPTSVLHHYLPFLSGLFSETIMDCESLSKIIGYYCYPVSEDGNILLIETPFRFEDGDDIFAYAELFPHSVRFFDDGDVYWHFAGLGIRMEIDENKKFVTDIAEAHGLTRTDVWEVEIVARPEQVAEAFAQYMAAMLEFVKWEKERDEALEALYREECGLVAPAAGA
jgi:hypothetical protein